MTAGDVRRRVERLESAGTTADTSAIVIYQVGETDEEMRARAPAGAEIVVYLPDNGRGPARSPAP